MNYIRVKIICLFYVTVFIFTVAKAETGYDLWQRYAPVSFNSPGGLYQPYLQEVGLSGASSTIKVIKDELNIAVTGFFGKAPAFKQVAQITKGVIFAKIDDPIFKNIKAVELPKDFGNEGFLIKMVKQQGKDLLIITANSDIGLMYGMFHLLRMVDTQQSFENINFLSKPKLGIRMLNHWDNLDRSVERGYAGNSIWNWHTLPGYIDKRYIDYARANASIGINGTALTNVNANATFLTADYIKKVKALADAFRPYGIKVYLTARFSAPIEIGKLKTADPLDKDVQNWWNEKAKEIYASIPDFGGFLVKANSEGQPGPQNYGRNHADGANMMAAALKPYSGIVIWRAFVYSNETPEDRFKQPYTEFVPLDGKFADNVILQTKNGPIDFQPREPFHPLFGALPKTPNLMEFQLTQEYLGFATHLVYLAPMFKEVLDSDTYRPTKGNTVAKVLDGSAFGHKQTGMAGVANIGSDINWTGHPFAQSNWYALGRLAWNHELSAAQIANEWIQQSFTRDPVAMASIQQLMMGSHEAVVNYMTPLGLHHIMGYGHHYGPAPWFNKASREDWNCTYFHKANEQGIGFDRTASGSNAIAQYAQPIQAVWGDKSKTDSKWITWFHRVGWNEKLDNGKSFWDNLCFAYQAGVDSVKGMQTTWKNMENKVDADRFNQVNMLLSIQYEEAVWWRDACLAYFQSLSKLPIPEGVAKPAHSLEYYQQLSYPFAPGNG